MHYRTDCAVGVDRNVSHQLAHQPLVSGGDGDGVCAGGEKRPRGADYVCSFPNRKGVGEFLQCHAAAGGCGRNDSNLQCDNTICGCKTTDQKTCVEMDKQQYEINFRLSQSIENHQIFQNDTNCEERPGSGDQISWDGSHNIDDDRVKRLKEKLELARETISEQNSLLINLEKKIMGMAHIVCSNTTTQNNNEVMTSELERAKLMVEAQILQIWSQIWDLIHLTIGYSITTLSYSIATLSYFILIMSYSISTLSYFILIMGYSITTLSYFILIMGYSITTLSYFILIMGYSITTLSYFILIKSYSITTLSYFILINDMT